jgi:hypothetical protein
MKNISSGPFAGLLLLGFAAGCAAPSPQEANARAFAAPTHLTATLVDPLNIDLKWKDNATAEAGYFVEYSPEANGEFVIIDALPPNSTHYRHPRLLPQTRFVYRVRPYFGKSSNVAEIKTGKEAPQQDVAPELLNDPPPLPPASKQSLRSAATIAAAAPTDLVAFLIPPAGAKLRWVDHASDADGYLLEIKPEWESDFKVSSFLAATNSSLVSYNFPFESKFQLRVRAFFYGQPSNTAEQTTGVDPTLGPGPWKKSGEGTPPGGTPQP